MNHSFILMDMMCICDWSFLLFIASNVCHYLFHRCLATDVRARSGVIVLPCGAGKTLGKTLTGVTASQTIKKSIICPCTNAVSVLQWKYQFKLWTNIPDENIAVFPSNKKEDIHPGGCVLSPDHQLHHDIV